MIAHPSRAVPIYTLGLVIALIGLATVLGARGAQAAPAGAAQSLGVYEQRCTSQGNVQVTFVWHPSGQGTQWFDVSRSPTFAGWQNQQLSPSAYFTTWTLESNTTYFVRVNTFTSLGWRTSDTLQVHTANCVVQFTPPSGVSTTTFDNLVRVSWNRGAGNLFFCLDTALTQSDLLNFAGSWRNWGCGTTGTSLDLTSLACGQTYFIRVWAAGHGVSGHSEIRSFVSQPCAFSPPSNPHATPLSETSARFQWTRGANNHFFCLDLATSQSDLVNLIGSWRNAGCGTTATQLDVSGLQCGTTYHWRVWAAGPGTSGYTPIATVTTLPCAFQPPHNLQSSNIDDDSATLSWSPGTPAIWYCADLAESQSHLVNFGSTWFNQCSGSATTVAVANLDCDTTYFWRVFAYAGNQSGYSQIRSFKTDAC